ncbi:tRNA1(Val) (adenine(37)-N6)-methyltransferase [Chthonobacter albigriseus]|uniref:tRNA1(Val) (adenine(37)-N6)-methyltransferase n=1 Tax=Chthonobacter albigriseus TaxID=1683161 RepID=UPI0015EE6087|nr:methyltransferase [Chthonobacter albigriseus]
MTDTPPAAAITTDGFLDRRLTILQPARGAHRAGLDAVLLAAAIPSGVSGTLVDLGAGVGVAGLAAKTRSPTARLVLVEIDPETAELARRNAAENRAAVGGDVSVAVVDVTRPESLEEAGLVQHCAAVAMMNPPYHPADRVRASPAQRRAVAHVIDPDDLERWLKTAAFLVHPQGLVAIIFRADELPRLFGAIGTRFGSLTVLPVHPRTGEAASRVLVTGRPQGRAPLRILPGLVLHEADGAWTAEADAVLRGSPLALS